MSEQQQQHQQAWDEQTDRAVRQFLATHRTGSLATTDETGAPHAANVWYVHDDALRLYFVSSPASAHAQHIARAGAIAITIHDDTPDPSQIHGLQVHAACEPLDAPSDRDAALARYAAKYPFVAHPAFRRRIEAERIYRATPTWMRWTDNRVRFGFKVEWRGRQRG